MTDERVERIGEAIRIAMGRAGTCTENVSCEFAPCVCAQIYARAAIAEAERWLPIDDDAPRDGTPILAAAMGVDGRWMRMIVRWGCREHAFSSKHHPAECLSRCECEWLGEVGMQYGVPITHWQHLPSPPKEDTLTDESQPNE